VDGFVQLRHIMRALRGVAHAAPGAVPCRALPGLAGVLRDECRELAQMTAGVDQDLDAVARAHERIEELSAEARALIRTATARALDTGDALQTVRCHDAFTSIEEATHAATSAARVLDRLASRNG
jgi:hypothetical protein